MLTSWGETSFIPAKKARVMCIVSLCSFLGLPFKTRVFIVISPLVYIS